MKRRLAAVITGIALLSACGGGAAGTSGNVVAPSNRDLRTAADAIGRDASQKAGATVSVLCNAYGILDSPAPATVGETNTTDCTWAVSDHGYGGRVVIRVTQVTGDTATYHYELQGS